MATAVSEFRGVMRFLLQDRDPNLQMFSDTVLDDGIRSAILLNQLPGFSLTADKSGVTPDFTDPNSFAVLCFKTTRMFVQSNPDSYSFKSRAFAERIGSYKQFLTDLDRLIYKAENGAMFSGWQGLYGFLAGISDLSLLEVYTTLRVTAPFYSVTLTATGGAAAS